MSIFTFIKDKVSILNIVSEYATLKKMGNYWKGVCPFHSERTASFAVSPHKEIFYCFGWIENRYGSCPASDHKTSPKHGDIRCNGRSRHISIIIAF